MRCSPAPSCEWSSPSKGLIPFEANPDIAGIGVIISFLAPAYVTLILALVSYVLGYVNEDRLRTLDWNLLFINDRGLIHNAPAGSRYPLVASRVQNRLGKRAPKYRKYHQAFRSAILVLRDLQLFSALFMLIAALQERCSISQYHFVIILDLGWIAVSVCGGTNYMVSSKRQDNPAFAWSRFVATMCFLLVFLASTFATWKYNFIPGDWDDGWILGLPAQCSLDPNAQWYFGSESPWVDLLLLWSLIDEINHFFPEIKQSKWLVESRSLISHILFFPGKLCVWSWRLLRQTQGLDHHSTTHDDSGTFPRFNIWRLLRACIHFGLCMILAPFAILALLWTVLLFSFWETIRSQFMDLFRIGTVLSFFTLDIKWYRDYSRDHGKYGDDEDKWGFGQLFPTLMLVLPVLAMLEAFWTAKHSIQTTGTVQDAFNPQELDRLGSAASESRETAMDITARKEQGTSDDDVVIRLPRTSHTEKQIRNQLSARARAAEDDLRDILLGTYVGQYGTLIVIPAGFLSLAIASALYGQII